MPPESKLPCVSTIGAKSYLSVGKQLAAKVFHALLVVLEVQYRVGILSCCFASTTTGSKVHTFYSCSTSVAAAYPKILL